MMKVILLQNVARLGKAGEIVDVAPGYGRNYLIPQGYAEILTKKGKRQVEVRKHLAERGAIKNLDTAQQLAGEIEGKSFEVKAKAGARGKLYGAVTTLAIAESISQATRAKIDKRQIKILEPIRILGSYDATIRLHPELQVDFKVNVTPAEGSKIDKG